jgi:hypothetical protein
MAPVDPAAWARAREAVHIYEAHETEHEHKPEPEQSGRALTNRKLRPNETDFLRAANIIYI